MNLENNKKLYYLFDKNTNRYQKSALLSDEEVLEFNDFLKHLDQQWVIPKFKDLRGRHVASLRSICETLPSSSHPRGQPGRCTCGLLIKNKIHYTNGEFERLSPESRFALGENEMLTFNTRK